MRVSGNAGLSPDVTPPAGGFGQGPTAGPVGIVAAPPPPRARSPIGFFVVGLGLLAAAGYIYWLGYQKYRLAEHGQGRAVLEELEPLVAESYRARGKLCPSATTLPRPGGSLPAEVAGATFAEDPGWRCLGFVSNRGLAVRVRYDRISDEQVLLTAGNGYRRRGVEVRWVLRGHVDATRATVAFDPIAEEPEP